MPTFSSALLFPILLLLLFICLFWPLSCTVEICLQVSVDLLFVLKIEALNNSLGRQCGLKGEPAGLQVVGVTVGHWGFKPAFLLGDSSMSDSEVRSLRLFSIFFFFKRRVLQSLP